MEISHPEHRELNNEKDVYLKISDILYFYKIGKEDKDKATKQLNFLKLIVKKNFNKEELLNLVEDIKNLLEKYDKNAYDEYMKKYNIEETIKKDSIIKFIK
ncbi:MAG: hypothetical protein ACP5GJ_02980 [Nanopusillaceae archaeon]|jgi:hypothetical protein